VLTAKAAERGQTGGFKKQPKLSNQGNKKYNKATSSNRK
jgi:hypothetical protein